MDTKKNPEDLICLSRAARFISDFALVERDIDKYYITASSLDDGACRKSLLRRGLYKAE
jgi:hypothetical protein